MRLTGKVAVVTGSTSGIGRGCAELFAEEGAQVIINGFPAESGDRVVAAIREKGGSATYCCADVRRSEDLRKLVRFAEETWGRLDILMNNACYGRSASVVEQEEDDWDEVFAASVRAAYLGSKYAIPLMIRAGGGSIIHTASVHGLLGGSRSAAYDAAKAALINLTRQMAVEYGKHGIRVNALCPGRILTEGKLEWLKERPDEVRRQERVYPLRRAGTVREAAMAALFLASDESSFITGPCPRRGWRPDRAAAGCRGSTNRAGADRGPGVRAGTRAGSSSAGRQGDGCGRSQTSQTELIRCSAPSSHEGQISTPHPGPAGNGIFPSSTRSHGA